MSDLFIAKSSAMVAVDGTPHRVRRGRTIAHPEHPIVAARPDLWRPLVVDFPADGASHVGDLDRYREHSQKLNAVAWRIADALGDIPSGATEHEGDDIDSLVDRLLAKAQTVPPAPPAPAPKAVRAWAKKAGVDCPARGPLPDELIAAYQAAHTQTEGS